MSRVGLDSAPAVISNAWWRANAWELLIQALIVVSVVSVGLETIPDLPNTFVVFLRWEEPIVVAVFTVEYLIRLIRSKRRLAFIFSFYGMVDLLAILPFYVSLGIDLRSVRVFRLLRIFRIFKLARYAKAAERLTKAFASVRIELVVFLGSTFVILYLCGTVIYYLEHDAQPEKFRSVLDGIWWALCTLTTVGYGDIYPVTWGGKVFTLLILMIGLAVVAIPAGLLASALVKQKEEKDARRDRALPDDN